MCDYKVTIPFAEGTFGALGCNPELDNYVKQWVVDINYSQNQQSLKLGNATIISFNNSIKLFLLHKNLELN